MFACFALNSSCSQKIQFYILGGVVDFIAEYAVFFAKTATVVIAVGVIMIMALILRQKSRRDGISGHLEVNKLNDFYKDLKDQIQLYVLEKDALKSLHKSLSHKAAKANGSREVGVFREGGNAHVGPSRAVAGTSAPLRGGYLGRDRR